MSDFTAILSNTIVASTNYGIKVTDGFNNIDGDTLLARLREISVVTDKLNSPHFLRAPLKLGTHGKCLPRSNENIESFSNLLIIDADKSITPTGEIIEGAPEPFLVAQVLKDLNISFVLYASYSHYTGLKGNRYRIICNTGKPYTPNQLAPTVESAINLINSQLGGNLIANALENSRFANAWFYATRPEGSTIEKLYLEFLEGNPVEISNPVELPPTNKIMKHDLSMRSGGLSAIDAFNTQNNITDLLLIHGYKRTGVGKDIETWLSPASQSGKAGIKVKDNKIYSHHSSDFFNNGYWHSAFDVMMVLDKLSFKDALIKAAQTTLAPDGASVDAWNKARLNINGENARTENILFEKYKRFNNDLLPVEIVPYDALPESMSEFIKEHSSIRGCPPDYILVSLLARLGSVFSGKIKIALTRNTNWHASPNFFWMMVGNSSSGKSNAFSLTSKPIQTLEEQARKKYKEEFRSYNDRYEVLERKLNAAYKAMERECAKKNCEHLAVIKFEESIKNLKQQIHELEEQKPKLKRYTIQKLTVEKLILILEENPEGIMLEIDELSSMFIRLSKDENGEERGLYLSGFNGNISHSYDTIKRGTVLIPNLVLSILGGAQPSKLRRFISEAKSGHQDDGLLQRFQGVVYPDKNLRLPADRKGNQILVNALTHIFQNLDSLPSSSMDSGATILQFNDDAQVIFDQWREETMTLAYELSYPLDAHVGKSYEFIAALSCYLYLYENNGHPTDNKKISAKHILSAIKLGKYFLSHAKRMYSLAYQDDMPARSLSEKLAKLVEGGKSRNTNYDPDLNKCFFTRSQIRVKGWSDLNTKEQRLEAITTLINMGHISKQLNGRYYINPEHLKE